MQPTAQQIEVWQSFKGVAKRTDLEVRAMSARFKQLQAVHAFKSQHNLPLNFDAAQMQADARRIYDRNDRLKRCIEQVELGHFGLRFEGLRLDIMAPAGTTADQIAPYQFSGWPIIIVGAIVVYAAIEVLADLSQRNHDMYEKCTNLVTHADSELCADPNSPICTDWNQTKADNNFDEQNGSIFGWFDEAKNWPSKVKTFGVGLGSGLLIAAAAAIGFWVWQRKNER